MAYNGTQHNNVMNANIPTAVIRRLNKNHTEDEIIQVFDSMFERGGLSSCIKSIKMSHRTDNKGEKYYFVIVVFNNLIPTSPLTREFTERLNQNEEIKILNVLGSKFYWKVCKYVSPNVRKLKRVADYTRKMAEAEDLPMSLEETENVPAFPSPPPLTRQCATEELSEEDIDSSVQAVPLPRAPTWYESDEE